MGSKSIDEKSKSFQFSQFFEIRFKGTIWIDSENEIEPRPVDAPHGAQSQKLRNTTLK